MKIYFAGSIRGGRNDVPAYQSFIRHLSTFGEVLTEHVGNPTLSKKGDDGPNDRYIHDRDMAWLASCDCIVAEVSTPSLGVGYELGHAVALKKPVLCLYRSGVEYSLSAMIAGSPSIEVACYNSFEEAWKIIAAYLERAANPGNG